MLCTKRSILFAGIVCLIGSEIVSAAEHPAPQAAIVPVDWSAIPDRVVSLFYPGESRYQWLRGPGHAAGRAAVSAGAACGACHTGQEAKLGERIVAGGLRNAEVKQL